MVQVEKPPFIMSVSSTKKVVHLNYFTGVRSPTVIHLLRVALHQWSINPAVHQVSLQLLLDS